MLIYLPIAEIPVNMFTILGMGAAVGFLSGLFGVGGGFLMTPLLIFSGIPPAVAVATVTSQVAASSTTGVISYWRRRAVDFKLGATLLTGGAVGTVLGVLFFNRMQAIGQLDLIIQLSYVTLLGGIGTAMAVESVRAILRARSRTPVRRPRAGRHAWFHGLPWKMRFPTSGIYVSVVPVVGLGVFIGFAGTLLGIGGGFILVPALIYLFRVPTAVVVGTSQFQILFTMLAATMLHATTNQSVDVVLGLLLIVGGVVGAQFGARAGHNIRGEHFRFLLALIVLTVGVRFAVDLMVRPDELFSLATRAR
ncbi:sulfite exporter TauE/SafE family protein [Labrys wisconsinensis]|uniref:Probable membrane transporter protein n=1 Tax=Labrys wisconsinensis TaxID=425677 RepID=A0ABU0JGV1_9HYPH|nr:sulfite exporter TauE/SafE family protein [Labrys wisconsinensis]MDQ0472352.1 putative membrane protein YfcA [Labrys wisconsinensis]